MTDSLKKVHTGDRLRIPAAAYNAFIDTATDAMNRRFDRAGSQGSQSESQTILVRNDSGDDQDRFAVLGVDAPIIAPEDNEAEFTRRVALSCVTPVDARHKGRFVVLAEPLADGKIGRAWASGVCVCKVDIKDDSHTTAEIVDGETANLESTINGTATILWKAGDTGVQWAVVRIGNTVAGVTLVPVLLVKISGDAGGGTSACNYVYKVFDIFSGLTGTPIKETASPAFARPLGEMAPATVGTGYYDASGNFILWQCDETPQVAVACVDEEES